MWSPCKETSLTTASEEDVTVKSNLAVWTLFDHTAVFQKDNLLFVQILLHYPSLSEQCYTTTTLTAQVQWYLREMLYFVMSCSFSKARFCSCILSPLSGRSPQICCAACASRCVQRKWTMKNKRFLVPGEKGESVTQEEREQKSVVTSINQQKAFIVNNLHWIWSHETLTSFQIVHIVFVAFSSAYLMGSSSACVKLLMFRGGLASEHEMEKGWNSWIFSLFVIKDGTCTAAFLWKLFHFFLRQLVCETDICVLLGPQRHIFIYFWLTPASFPFRVVNSSTVCIILALSASEPNLSRSRRMLSVQEERHDQSVF